MIWTRCILVALGYFAWTVPLALGGTTWEAANAAYQHGKYEEAKVDYLQLAHTGQYSADLFYNLGNVWFKLGDPGRAILNYQRALLLNPGLVEAGSNLRTVLKIVGNDDQPTFRDQIGAYADYFPLDRLDRFLDICFFSFPGLAEARAPHSLLSQAVHRRRSDFFRCRSPFRLDRFRIERCQSSSSRRFRSRSQIWTGGQRTRGGEHAAGRTTPVDFRARRLDVLPSEYWQLRMDTYPKNRTPDSLASPLCSFLTVCEASPLCFLGMRSFPAWIFVLFLLGARRSLGGPKPGLGQIADVR